jgi:putative salt-induced outer membrane protein
MKRSMRNAAALFLSGVVSVGFSYAEEPKRPWTDTADFGLTLTTGNTENLNFALGNKFKYTWSRSELLFDALALRNQSTSTAFTYDGTTVTETDTKTVTAEAFALALKYRHDITERLYWFAATSWYRNTLAGLDARYLAGGGIGYIFVQKPNHVLKGEAGLDYTRQDPVGDAPPPELETKDFASAHFFLGYEYKISETAKLTEDLNLFDNLDTTSDWRANSVTSVTASMTSKLAIKVSYTVLYSNEPPVRLVPDTVAPIAADAVVPFEKTDTILAAALVVNF